MLLPGPDGDALIVCTTCRGPGRVDGGGAALASEIAARAADPRYAALAVAGVACLWSCAQGAAAQLRHPAKIGYVMGGFGVADAPDLLEFALAYAASADGDVPYDRWPRGILGHFIARTPPPQMSLG